MTKPFLRVIVETHDSRLEMDTRAGTGKYIEARAVEAIRAGCVGMIISAAPGSATRFGLAEAKKQLYHCLLDLAPGETTNGEASLLYWLAFEPEIQAIML